MVFRFHLYVESKKQMNEQNEKEIEWLLVVRGGENGEILVKEHQLHYKINKIWVSKVSIAR